jgi:hypothetical protein
MKGVGRQPPIYADLAVVDDCELVTADRSDAIVAHHSAEDTDGDLHLLSVARTKGLIHDEANVTASVPRRPR